MRIAVPSYSPGGLSAEVCPHFGRAEVITVVEVEGAKPVKVEVVDSGGQHYGYPRRPAEALTSLNVDAVAVKGLGVKALEWLNQAGIKVYRVTADRVEEAINQILRGELQEMTAEEACAGGYGLEEQGFTSAWRPPFPGPMRPWPTPPVTPPQVPMPAQRPLEVSGRVKVAVASQGQGGLDDLVSPMFGRCPVFTVIEIEGGEVKSIETLPNQAMYAPHGAGIAAVQAIANMGVRIAIAGRFGPWAYQAMTQFGIQPITVPPGIKVRDAINRYVLGR